MTTILLSSTSGRISQRWRVTTTTSSIAKNFLYRRSSSITTNGNMRLNNNANSCRMIDRMNGGEVEKKVICTATSATTNTDNSTTTMIRRNNSSSSSSSTCTCSMYTGSKNKNDYASLSSIKIAKQQKRYHHHHQQQQQQHCRQKHANFNLQHNLHAFNTNANNTNNRAAFFRYVTKRWHGGPHIDHDDADVVHINFVLADGETVKTVDAYVGESLLQVAHRNDGIDLEGACEGVCACATCHVILDEETDLYDELEEPSEDEEDMLDMAFGLTETSRLGCQVIVNEDMDETTIHLPKATRNFYVDGHVPQPH